MSSRVNEVNGEKLQDSPNQKSWLLRETSVTVVALISMLAAFYSLNDTVQLQKCMHVDVCRDVSGGRADGDDHSGRREADGWSTQTRVPRSLSGQHDRLLHRRSAVSRRRRLHADRRGHAPLGQVICWSHIRGHSRAVPQGPTSKCER